MNQKQIILPPEMRSTPKEKLEMEEKAEQFKQSFVKGLFWWILLPIKIIKKLFGEHNKKCLK